MTDEPTAVGLPALVLWGNSTTLLGKVKSTLRNAPDLPINLPANLEARESGDEFS
jgi:hypothetical protein